MVAKGPVRKLSQKCRGSDVDGSGSDGKVTMKVKLGRLGCTWERAPRGITVGLYLGWKRKRGLRHGNFWTWASERYVAVPFVELE